MSIRRPVSDQERTRILTLARSGMGRNDIARELGRTPSVITTIVRAAGYSFDMSKVEVAVKARSVRMAEMRQQLADEMLLNAIRMNQAAAHEAEQTMLGAAPGGGSEWYTTTLPVPPARDQKDLTQAASIAANAAMKLVEFDRGDSGTDTAKSMVTNLVLGLAKTLQE